MTYCPEPFANLDHIDEDDRPSAVDLDDDEPELYEIFRSHQRPNEPTIVLRGGLTLEEAQEHCSDPETASRTATSPEAIEYAHNHGPFFDGYRQE